MIFKEIDNMKSVEAICHYFSCTVNSKINLYNPYLLRQVMKAKYNINKLLI